MELYTALHPEDTGVTQDMLRLVTIRNVLTDNLYNDLGFMVGDRLMILVEAQSAWSVNIILRALLYLAQSYKEYFEERKVNLYSSSKADVPRPELYVLYTGTRTDRPETISLTEEFFGGEPGALEVKVKVLYGEDTRDIIGQYARFCRVLKEQTAKYGNGLEAVTETIRVCRDEHVLADYLTQREKEAMDIMVMLFDDEYIQEAYEKELEEKYQEEGRLKNAKENALSFYEEGLPVATIAKCLKYPIEVIRGWLGLQPV